MGGICLSANFERNRCFLIALYHLILRIPNLKVVNKRLFQYCTLPCTTWKCASIAISNGVSISRIPGCHVRWVPSEGYKNYFKDWYLMNSQPTFLILTYFLNQGNSSSFKFWWIWIFPQWKLSWHTHFMASFYGWVWTASRLELLRGDSLLFITKYPEIHGSHFINLGRIERLNLKTVQSSSFLGSPLYILSFVNPSP